MRYLPADKCDIDELCDALVTRCLVVLYGDGYAFIPSFGSHQHVNPREAASRIPEPDESTIIRRVDDASARVDDASNLDVNTQVGKERKGKERNTRGSRKTPIPDEFSISEEVLEWALANNHMNLDRHFSHFVDACKAKGYQYIDWDAAFKNAIKGNWAKVDTSRKAFDPTVLSL